MKESKLMLGWDDALLGEGEGGFGMTNPAELRSFPLLLFLSFLLCLRCLSMTISMESYGLEENPFSGASVLIGVMGGVESRKEEELVLEIERATDEDALEDLNLERKSEFERDL